MESIIHNINQTIFIAIHSDCFCAASSHTGTGSLLAQFTNSMTSCKLVSSMSPVTRLNNIDSDTTSTHKIVLNQATYIASIIQEHHSALEALPTRPPITPADEDPTTGLAAHVAKALKNHHNGNTSSTSIDVFQTIVTSLTHCAFGARPDIAYATGMLTR